MCCKQQLERLKQLNKWKILLIKQYDQPNKLKPMSSKLVKLYTNMITSLFRQLNKFLTFFQFKPSNKFLDLFQVLKTRTSKQLKIMSFIIYNKNLHKMRFKLPPVFILVTICAFMLGCVHSSELNETIDCLKGYIETLQTKMVQIRPQLFRIFKKSFPNTLQTTVQHYNISSKGDQQTYIITGDIQAMWLRDSTNQWLPYLKLQRQCPHVKQLTKGLINTQAKFIMTEPYTNAFKKFQQNTKDRPFYLRDKTQKLIFGIPVDLCKQRDFATKSIWERKWQIDSLASFLRLTYQYYNKYHDLSIVNMNFVKAMKRIMTTLDEQIKDQNYQKQLNANFYTFYRDQRELANGTIKPSSKTGMIKTGFRPSDDPNQLPYNIPGNAMMASFLQLVSKQVLSKVPQTSVYYNIITQIQIKMQYFTQNILSGIKNYAIVQRPLSQGGNVYAYEVDGMGKFRLYDDANLPSLLSLPYLGFVKQNDPLYINTRKLILSVKNPFYYQRQQLKGLGSSHTQKDYVWPLAIIVQALTSDSDEEIKNCLYNLQKSAMRDLMHESFSVNNPSAITREWFAWANSFFGEMIMTLQRTKPHLLK